MVQWKELLCHAALDSPSQMILATVLQRLYASLVRGAGMNCHPDVRARTLDLASLARESGLEPHRIIAELFAGRDIEVFAAEAAAGAPVPLISSPDVPKRIERSPGDRERLLGELKALASDASEFEQTRGRNILRIGFPLLGAPPAEERIAEAYFSFQSMAPVAFVPVELSLKGHLHPSVSLRLRDPMDCVMPNPAVMAWIEHRTGKQFSDLIEPEGPLDPYQKVNRLVQFICDALEMEVIPVITAGTPLGPVPQIVGTKRHFFSAAVLGLFPWDKEGLLRDTAAMAAGKALPAILGSFSHIDLSNAPAAPAAQAGEKKTRDFSEERFVAGADPFQARSLRLIRHHPSLIIHGPPGTGKSQTIVNMIGDYLAAGERVLVVSNQRASLDVLKCRLDRLGFGDLAVVVPDPERLSREFQGNLSLRIASLTQANEIPPARLELERMDDEQTALHEELARFHEALIAPSDDAAMSFHEMVGSWLAIDPPEGVHLDGIDLSALHLAALRSYQTDIEEILAKGRAVDYPTNPWCGIVGEQAGDFLARFPGRLGDWAEQLVRAAQTADAALAAELPGFEDHLDLVQQAKSRLALAGRMEELESTSGGSLGKWAAIDYETIRKLGQELGELAPCLETMRRGPLDPGLAPRAKAIGLEQLNQSIEALNAFEPLAGKWSRFFALKKKAAARRAAAALGLGLAPAEIRRALDFLESSKARLLLSAFLAGIFSSTAPEEAMEEGALAAALAELVSVGDLFRHVHSDPALVPLADPVRGALAQPSQMSGLMSLLKSSRHRAESLVVLETALQSGELLDAGWRAEAVSQLRRGASFSSLAKSLQRTVHTLENVVELRSALARLPEPLWRATVQLLGQGADPESGWQAVLKSVLSNEITRHLREQAALSETQLIRVQTQFQRAADLVTRKQKLVAQQIAHYWQLRQWDRMLGPTGNELNFRGLRLRERFPALAGPSLKWRQIIREGLDITGGDAIYDMCPVWLTSPAAAAQIFPLEPMFDLVVFDDASQCGIEEAFPVIARGKRVVIVGDAQQALATSSVDPIPPEGKICSGGEDPFVQPLNCTESFFDALLSSDLPQSYLGVHYRSRDERLFDFSNRHFYGSRLQPLPLHPSRKIGQLPIRLYRVDGTCLNQANRKEAERVARLAQELLSRPEAPSLGIACFSSEQRNEILNVLEEAAESDPHLAAGLERSRNRRDTGGHEGLFVKSVEHIQGDERDHIIISTTFGPEQTGKWKRKFGPLGNSAGARWLNALVTGARTGVHVVTSIPRYEYAALPVLKPNQSPNGGWFLYAYLHYAETLEAAYEESQQAQPRPENRERADVAVRESASGSAFARALAQRLARGRGISSEVQCGNDGFCVDVALRRPGRDGDMALGLLCDLARFPAGLDAVDWDAFKTSLLDQQGWKLMRVWTPRFFLNPEQGLALIAEETKRIIEEEKRGIPPLDDQYRLASS